MVTTTMCVSGMVLQKAGAGVSTALSNGGYFNGSDFIVDVWITEAESFINLMSRKDYTAIYTTLTASKRKLLQELASSMAAIYAIQYDMSGYTSRTEAEDMINILRDIVLRDLSLLRTQNARDFLDAA